MLPQDVQGGVSSQLPTNDDVANEQQGNGFDFGKQINSLPPEANDIDLIEKEWVTHLKHIVTQTTGDPHRQQLEISLAKADYLMKRYGKEVIASEN